MNCRAIATDAVENREALQEIDELAELLELLCVTKPRVIVEIGSYRGGTLWAWNQIVAQDALIVGVDSPFASVYDKLIRSLNTPSIALDHIRNYRASLSWSLKLLHLAFDSGKIDQGYGEKSHAGKQIMVLHANSQKPRTQTKVRDLIEGKSIDFLFIDGDHSYEGVSRDYELYSSLVAPGGIIAFHDILLPTSGVPRLWDEIKSSYRHREIVSPAPKNPDKPLGIGILWNN